MAFVDYFELLGVSEHASAAELRRAYRARAFEIHPDRNPGDPRAAEAFWRLTRAREVLLDPALRARHLAERERWRAQEARRAERQRAAPKARPPEERFRGARRDDWTALRARREGVYNNARRDHAEDAPPEDPLSARGLASAILLAGLAWGLGRRS
ncbi:MAG: J domain-containing protein [Alphaproteobacteria bacterium]|nr:J domain-containing protein [Alphaproteobacteria bacterium]